MNKYKTLASNTAFISIGTFGSKILVFLMVRFYTGCLTTSDYGTADLITQTANLLVPLISLGITDGVFRFAMDKSARRGSVFTVGLYSITGGAVLFAIAVPLLGLVTEFRGYIWLIVLFTMASCYHSLCAQFIRGRGKTSLFALQGIINTVLVIGLNVVFLAVFSMGITGYVLSTAIADIVCTLFLFVKEKLWREIVLRPEKQAFTEMLKYSVPLIPTTVFWWITNVSDRYMVNGFIGSDANGIYAVAYKLPTILILVSSIFTEAWQFSAVSEADGDMDEHISFYSKVWRAFMGIMVLAATLIIAFSKVEISLLSTESYYEAWKYVPVLSVAMIFAAYVTFMGSVYLVTKKSVLSFATAMVGAVLNLILNFILIPSPLGVQGAAIATFASYFVVFIIRCINARRLIPFSLHTGILVANTLVLAVQVSFMVYELPMWLPVQIICVAVLAVLNYKPLLESIRKVLTFVKKR